MNAGFAELLRASECTVDAGQGLKKPWGLSPASSATDSLCDLEHDILSSISVFSSEDIGEVREMRPFLCLLVRLYIIGYSEVEVSRISVAAVSLHGPMNWDSVALLIMVFLWQMLLNLSYSLFLFLFLFDSSSLALVSPLCFSTELVPSLSPRVCRKPSAIVQLFFFTCTWTASNTILPAL